MHVRQKILLREEENEPLYLLLYLVLFGPTPSPAQSLAANAPPSLLARMTTERGEGTELLAAAIISTWGKGEGGREPEEEEEEDVSLLR